MKGGRAKHTDHQVAAGNASAVVNWSGWLSRCFNEDGSLAFGISKREPAECLRALKGHADRLGEMLEQVKTS